MCVFGEIDNSVCLCDPPIGLLALMKFNDVFSVCRGYMYVDVGGCSDFIC